MPMDVERARFFAHKAIDEAAGVARLQFATSAPLQDTVYRLKLEQAEAYIRAHEVAPTAEVPIYVAIDADENGLSPVAAAQRIVEQATLLAEVAGPVIERRRARGKRSVQQAFELAGSDETRIAAIKAASEAAVEQLQQPIG